MCFHEINGICCNYQKLQRSVFCTEFRTLLLGISRVNSGSMRAFAHGKLFVLQVGTEIQLLPAATLHLRTLTTISVPMRTLAAAGYINREYLNALVLEQYSMINIFCSRRSGEKVVQKPILHSVLCQYTISADATRACGNLYFKPSWIYWPKIVRFYSYSLTSADIVTLRLFSLVSRSWIVLLWGTSWLLRAFAH